MSDHNHFPIAAAIGVLADVVDKHDAKTMIQASGYLDMAPTILLRGISFLSECLEAYKDPPPMQAKLARSAIQEITALCAVLIEVDCMASSHRLLMEREGAGK